MAMNKGLPGFKQLLKEFQQLGLWAAGGAAAPFAARLVALSPPWPAGIVVVTSMFELVSLVFVYQFLSSSPKRTINRILIGGALALILFGPVYLVATSLYTYETPRTKERFVKGYACTSNAQAVFKDDCPLLSSYQIATANYEAESLWTEQSIAVVRIVLVVLWLGAFGALSVVLGSFVVYQSRVRAPKQSKSVAATQQ